jgi:hypothetical protein
LPVSTSRPAIIFIPNHHLEQRNEPKSSKETAKCETRKCQHPISKYRQALLWFHPSMWTATNFIKANENEKMAHPNYITSTLSFSQGGSLRPICFWSSVSLVLLWTFRICRRHGQLSEYFSMSFSPRSSH